MLKHVWPKVCDFSRDKTYLIIHIYPSSFKYYRYDVLIMLPPSLKLMHGITTNRAVDRLMIYQVCRAKNMELLIFVKEFQEEIPTGSQPIPGGCSLGGHCTIYTITRRQILQLFTCYHKHFTEVFILLHVRLRG
jgi:hypothetical protein